ncbi:YbaB/EbfC family nucleoid-associated protein [Spirochaeta africana]|uniref:Nucleoid-associated protein Spiaf_2861 n=1 Tax=Spirochaeta africana (strain ATCC 700263 / DSM 8902 / Z-7692) TaxID=889378 RepID=H9UMZ2_SPIAZ|nr:YbaB/EbfC family nucleoid-associated protein [Spirochaeta africana]AFG38885.1 DNA-binding protein, YbaB/EbfC family [Spirochaeta africana DSM 8902]
MNPMDLFKNLSSLQSKMGEAQEQLKHISVTGTAGGDMVRITMNGEFTVLKVEISPDVIDPNDPELIQDLVLAAATDAQHKAKEVIREQMSSLTGGMNLPPDLFNMGNMG